MALRGLKVKAGDRVMYEGLPARVLEVTPRKLKIRDAFGYPKTVSKSVCSKYTG